MAFGTAVILVASSFAFTGTSGATHPEMSLAGSNFEIDTDANLRVDDPPPSIDWLEGSSLRVTPTQDVPSGGGDNAFGNGSKEDTAVPSVVTGGIPPNKSDLKNFGIYTEVTDTASFLHLFWTRVQDPSGTTNMDFEFNHSRDTSSNGVTPVRTPQPSDLPGTPKDLLITYDLSNGGTVATMSMREWQGSAWGPSRSFGANAAGTINTTAITVAGSLGTLSPRTFGEASINLASIFSATGGCQSFGSAYLKSRSSDTFNSALKDFIAPQSITLSNCGSVDIHKQDDSGNALGGVNFKLYNDVSPVGGVRDPVVVGVTEPSDDTLTDPLLQCTTATATIGTDTLGDCTILNVPFGQYWVVETAPPTGYLPAPDQNVVVTRAVPTPAVLTFTNNRNPAALTIHKQDDASTPNPLSDVVFTLYNDNAPDGTADAFGAEDTVTNPALACTTLANGTCTIPNILVPGPYWVVETTSKPGYDTAPAQRVVLAAGDSNTAAPLTFVNARNFKVIVLVCKESGSVNGTLYSSAVTINGQEVGNSLATVGTGLTESALCGITDGDLGGLSSTATGTTYPATVAIRSSPAS